MNSWRKDAELHRALTLWREENRVVSRARRMLLAWKGARARRKLQSISRAREIGLRLGVLSARFLRWLWVGEVPQCARCHGEAQTPPERCPTCMRPLCARCWKQFGECR